MLLRATAELGSESGLAYCDVASDSFTFPFEAKADEARWSLSDDKGLWSPAPLVAVLGSTANEHVFHRVRHWVNWHLGAQPYDITYRASPTTPVDTPYSATPSAEHGAQRLRDGTLLPALGVGLGGLRPDQVWRALRVSSARQRRARTQIERVLADALRIGFKLVDGAEAYESEHIVGEFLRRNDVLRARLYLASKVWPTHMTFEATSASIERSLQLMHTFVVVVSVSVCEH